MSLGGATLFEPKGSHPRNSLRETRLKRVITLSFRLNFEIKFKVKPNYLKKKKSYWEKIEIQHIGKHKKYRQT